MLCDRLFTLILLGTEPGSGDTKVIGHKAAFDKVTIL